MKSKIAFVASYPHSLINFRLALMKEFICQGYEVIAVAPHDKAVAETLAQHGIRYSSVRLDRNGINPFSDVKLLIKLYQIFKHEKPVAIFSYTIKPVIYGSIAARFAKVTKIYSMVTGTGYVFLNNNLKNKIVSVIARTLFRFALYFNTCIFFQNKDNLALFKQMKIINFSKPAAIINGSGVDCVEFKPSLYPENISFLMIARFLLDKGIREYVSAAKMIKQKYPHIKFRLVGWIDTNPNSISEQELNSWIAEGIIEYLGKLEDVRPAITDSSVYVLPSYHEGTPRTVLEAMAMARPIITTDAPGCRETVICNKNGFLIPVKDIAALYAAMEYFIMRPDEIKRMGEESRNLAVEKYDVNKVNKSILTIIK